MTAFVKMHGLGNDFVVFDARHATITLPPSVIRKLADRHFGIGCDTVVVIGPGPANADASLTFYNADGQKAESCGNATRCVARLLIDESGLTQVTLATQGGQVVCHDAGQGLVSVDMGAPVLDWAQIPMAQAHDTTQFTLTVEDQTITASAASMGNPHCILFVEDADTAPVTLLGPKIEILPLFPNRVNVEFAQVLDNKHIRMRVWERGVGVTLACGTGACATLVAAVRRGLSAREAEIILDGGSLFITWRDDNHVIMTGPAVTAFHGQVDLEQP